MRRVSSLNCPNHCIHNKWPLSNNPTYPHRSMSSCATPQRQSDGWASDSHRKAVAGRRLSEVDGVMLSDVTGEMEKTTSNMDDRY